MAAAKKSVSAATRRSRAGRTTARGEETRARILAVALTRFRRRGSEATTMREIAEAAGVALGAAYYYFPSKDAIVLAYLEETQRRSAQKAAAAFEQTQDVRERLGAAMHARLDAIRGDRSLLSALFRTIADPQAELSIFSERTSTLRAQSIAVFDEALSTSPEFLALDADARAVLVLALWSLHMAFILYFLHDTSPQQQKSRVLVDQVLDLVVGVLPLAPSLAPVLGQQLAKVLRDADLLPHQ